MTPKQKMLVQLSFTKLSPHIDSAAELLFGRFFELDPAARGLFEVTDMKAQGRKFFQMLGLAVRNVDHLDEIGTQIEQMGRRHVGYGVREPQYDTLGQALMWALEQTLGAELSGEEKQAWAETYRLLAEAAKQGATRTPGNDG